MVNIGRRKSEESNSENDNNETNNSIRDKDFWESSADVAKHLVEVHKEPVRAQLSDDAILFMPDDILFEFVRKQTRTANSIHEFIKHKPYAEAARDMVMNDVHVVMILKRNDPKNWIVKALTEKSLREEGVEEERSALGKLVGRIKGGGNPQPQFVEMEE